MIKALLESQSQIICSLVEWETLQVKAQGGGKEEELEFVFTLSLIMARIIRFYCKDKKGQDKNLC